MKIRIVLIALLAALAFPVSARAWGSTGHTMINRLAAQHMPAMVPAFLRSTSAVDEIATLGPEEDRIKGSGQSWDGDNDPGHFLDVDDSGAVAGVVRLDALPPDMAAYADALASRGETPYKAGYVPYAIMDGFERVREDLAYWRVDAYASTHARTAAARARFGADRALREALTLRDIGVWGHFVGDGCQPLHLTVHYNGWGHYSNPRHFTARHIHAFFESTFVDRYARDGDVAHRMTAAAPLHRTTRLSQQQIGTIVGRYLSGTAAQVTPLYELYQGRAFQSGSPTAVAFTDAQLARGASMLRDLIVLAWEDSLNGTVGYPPVPVRDVVSGKVLPVGL